MLNATAPEPTRVKFHSITIAHRLNTIMGYDLVLVLSADIPTFS